MTRALFSFAVAAALSVAPALPVFADVAVEPIASDLSSPVQALSPAGDERIFVVEKTGRIRIIDSSGSVLPTPFLDISSLVSRGSEQGLLGMAFHPDFPANPRFYVNYTDSSGDTRVMEYQVGADPNLAETSTARLIIRVDQPYSNHNAGMLAFGPDGYLYVGLGDGGSGNDPQRNGQNTSTLLGSMLRLDVSGDDYPGDPLRNYRIPASNPFVGSAGADEIFAYGLRNPWRYSFDGSLLWIGDVGQNAREEVSVIDVTADAGANLGWRTWEGDVCTGLESSCGGPFEPAVHSYSHSEGCSITGGVVSRSTAVPDMAGQYLYSDFCSGWIKSFAAGTGPATGHRDWTNWIGGFGNVTSLGTDGHGEVLITEYGGSVWRLTAGAERLFGDDRYATSVEVSRDTFSPGVPVLYAATGTAFPDALAAAAAAGAKGGPVLLVPPTGVPGYLATEISRLTPAEIVVVGGPAAVPDGVKAQLEALAPTRRVGGVDRFDTAARLATEEFNPGVKVAYVATGRDFPDALAAAARAGAEGGPVLLVDTDAVPAVTEQALSALSPDVIVVVGGPAVVSGAVVGRLETIAPTTRVWGADRYSTAAALSSSVATADTVFVATGLDFPDALTGAAAAAHTGVPLLLTARVSVPGSTAGALARLRPERVVVLGGHPVIDRSTSRELLLATE